MNENEMTAPVLWKNPDTDKYECLSPLDAQNLARLFEQGYTHISGAYLVSCPKETADKIRAALLAIPDGSTRHCIIERWLKPSSN